MPAIKSKTLINSLPFFCARLYNILNKYDIDSDHEDIRVFNSFNDDLSIEYLDGESIRRTVDFYFDSGEESYLLEAAVMLLMLNIKHQEESLAAQN